MTEITFSDPCIVFALRRESRYFRREFRPQQPFPGAPCPAWFRGPTWLTVLVLECGVGAAAAERVGRWLLSGPVFGNVPYRPKLVLAAGFAGALTSGQHVGDLVLATEVVEPGGECWPTTWPGELPPEEWRPPLKRGRVLTNPELVGEPGQKRRLGDRHQALAVDMESAVLARLCRQKQVPFGCVRAISDDRDTPLSPRLIELLRHGRVAPWRLLGALVRQPGLVPELWRLAGHTRTAARQLGLGLGELLTLTLPWMEDAPPAPRDG